MPPPTMRATIAGSASRSAALSAAVGVVPPRALAMLSSIGLANCGGSTKLLLPTWATNAPFAFASSIAFRSSGAAPCSGAR